jgi:LysR family glycine cleavage system transcriptional activator
MRTYLPLNALRAFESAARHLSFARAAEELHVTPTAISHQVRSLEDFLEIDLFERKNGRLALTAAAAASLQELSEGFDKLAAAFSPLNRRASGQKIAVGVSPSVASLWLMPRLRRFFALAPGIEVSISAVIAPADFDEAALDVSICCTDAHPNRTVDYLMDEQVLPVCAPSLLEGADTDPRAALAALPLIHDDKANDKFPTWRRYFEERQLPVAHPSAGLRFNQSSLAIEAALNGHGLLLGRSRLIAGALANRKLVPVDEPYPVPCHYYTVRKPGSVAKPVRMFLDWLAQEVRDDPVPPGEAPVAARCPALEAAHPRPLPRHGSSRQAVSVGLGPAETHRLARLDRRRKEEVVGK